MLDDLDVAGVASELAHAREGYRLINYTIAALPVYRLQVKAYVLSARALDPIEEFVLQAVGLGIHSTNEISSVLGLDCGFVASSPVAKLIQAEHLDYNGPQLQLTPHGKKAVDELVVEQPEERTITLLYDTLLMDFASVDEDALLSTRARKEAEFEFPEIRVQGSVPKQLDDLRFDRLRAIAAKTPGKKSWRLLEPTAITKRDRLLLPIMLLVYQSVDGDDLQVAVIVDGRPSEQHEARFAEAGLIDTMGIRRSALAIEETDAPEPAEMSVSEVEEVLRAAATAKRDLVEAEAAMHTASTREERDRLREVVEASKHEIERLNQYITSVRARAVAVHEHRPILLETFRTAKSRILLVCPFLEGKAVDRVFIREVENALLRGIQVYVAYGLDERREKGAEDKPSFRIAEERLQELAYRFSNLNLTRLGNDHSKILACDESFVITTSFNWLSFRGDPNMAYRNESGVRNSDPELVDSYFDRYIPLISPNAETS